MSREKNLMKRCSQCHQTYPDDNLNFCLSDGTSLVFVSDSSFEETVISPSPFVQQTSQPTRQGVSPLFAYSLIGLLALIVGGGIVFLLRLSDGVSSVSPAKIDNSTPSSSSNPAPPNELVKQPVLNQNTAIVRNSQVQTAVVAQPTSDYATKNVRVGTADGKRLRVVVDLTRTSLNTGSPAQFETLASAGASGEAKFFVHTQSDNFLSVKYESKQTPKLGTVLLSPSSQGLEIRVIPQSRLYLRDVFFIQRSAANLNDRLVIDLCLDPGCPSLRP
jgi:hypothetical protein